MVTGCHLQLRCHLPLFCNFHMPVAHHLIKKEVDELLAKGAIEP